MFPISDSEQASKKDIGFVMEDISSRKAMLASALNRKEDLANAARLRMATELATGIAHELNQPLAAVVNYAEGTLKTLLNDQINNNSLKDQLERMVNQAHLAGKIIAKFRDFVRSGVITRRPVKPDGIIQDALGFIDHLLRRHRIRVDCQPSTTPLPLILVDLVQIQQVLLNLLSNSINALKDVPEDRRMIVISMETNDGFLKIRLRDHGPGFSQEVLQNWTCPFHASTTGGLGLGLTICKNLIEENGGKMWLESPPTGTGAVVCLLLCVHGGSA
jgi:C4-dicarboxylate-specific signal transduction histidine kinase